MRFTFSAKKALFTAVAAAAVFAVSVPAYAASKKKEVSVVHFKVNTKEIFDGDTDRIEEDELSTDMVNIKDDAPYSLEKLEFANGGPWKMGQEKTIYATLEINDTDDYRFASGWSDSNIKIDEGSSYVVSKNANRKNQYTLKVSLKLKGLVNDLDVPDDLHWSGKSAKWDKVTGAEYYEVKLLRDSKAVGTYKTKKTTFDLYHGMKKEGDYTFQVRAINKTAKINGDWSDESNDLWISDSKKYTGNEKLKDDLSPDEETRTVPTGDGPSGTLSPNGKIATQGWIQDQAGWRYLEDGSAVANSWRFIDDNWYYMDGRGYMVTGWFHDGTGYFYMNPVSDGYKGSMKTGWVLDNEKWYYTNPVSDGTRGKMLTGYQMINGRWYFFDPTSGELWTSRMTPDGRWAGTDGTL